MLPDRDLERVEKCACFRRKGRGSSVRKRENASERLRTFSPGAVEALTWEKFDSADRVAGCLHATMAACVYTPYIHVIHDRVRVNVSFYNASAVVLRCTSMSF